MLSRLLPEAAACALAGVLLVAPLAAGAAEEEAAAVGLKRLSVNYSDADLASRDGRIALNRRLKLAAREVCRSSNARFDSYVDEARIRRCEHTALARAKAAVYDGA